MHNITRSIACDAFLPEAYVPKVRDRRRKESAKEITHCKDLGISAWHA